MEVSIVLCAFNSATRLPDTLTHIAAQICPEIVRELVLVDKASNDRNRSLMFL